MQQREKTAKEKREGRRNKTEKKKKEEGYDIEGDLNKRWQLSSLLLNKCMFIPAPSTH